MSQHALNNLITHAAKQRPETRRGPGPGYHWPLGSTSPTYLAARPPTRVLGSTVRTDTTRVPRRRSDRVFLSILLSLVCVRSSDLFVDLYDQCAMAMRLPIPACTVAVQRACDAPQHICECERVGGGTGGDRPSLLLVSRQHSTAKVAEAAKIDHRHRTSWTLECTSSGGRSGARPYDPDPSAFPFTIH